MFKKIILFSLIFLSAIGLATAQTQVPAKNIKVNTTSFTTNLTASETDVQKALDKLDKSASSVAGNPAGSDTQLQKNNTGVFGGANIYDVNGNVGIGTTGPNYKLDVNGAMQAASGNFSGTGSFVQGSNFTIDFDDAGLGSLRLCATNLENVTNNCVDFDMGTDASTWRILSPTGITHTSMFGDLSVANKVATPVVQVGTTASTSWDVSSLIVAKYLFEDSAADTVVTNSLGDTSYNGVSSVNTSGLSTAGKINSGFNFTGSQTISINNSNLDFSHDMSVCGWFNTTHNNINLTGNRIDASPFNGWKIAVSTSGFLAFLVDGGTPIAQALSGVIVNDGAWHLGCGVRKEGEFVKVYIDGVQAGNFVDTNFYSIATGSTLTKIGDIPLVSVSNGDPWNGKMDNVSFYNGALTDAMVAGLWNNGAGTDGVSGGSGVNSGKGCVMILDQDGNGFTELLTQKGILTVHEDTNGICDGI